MDDETRKALLILVRAALGRQDHAELQTLQADLEDGGLREQAKEAADESSSKRRN